MLEIISPGMLALIEDLGRPGYQRFGVPESGAMDRNSLMLANALVANPLGAAAIEALLLPPVLRFHTGASFAACGGACSITLESGAQSREVPMNRSVAVQASDIVRFSALSCGLRLYIAVSGGLDVPLVMGSRSASGRARAGGIADGLPLRAGDRIAIGAGKSPLPARVAPDELLTPLGGDPVTLRVLPGPEAESFSREGLRAFYGSEYLVSNRSDRMGIRFSGERIAHAEGRGADILSDAIPLGAIQVPSDGEPILMMAERQTTGGYTRIACLIGADAPVAAQLRPGDRVRFSPSTLPEAHALLKARREAFLRWHASVNARVLRVVVNGASYDVTITDA